MFSYRLKQLRENTGITQDDLAKLLNLTQSTIAYYESGRKMPTLENTILIAKIFNTSLDYLVGISNYRETEYLKEDMETYCPTLLLNDINTLSADSLRDLKYFIAFLKFRDLQTNNIKCNNKKNFE